MGAISSLKRLNINPFIYKVLLILLGIVSTGVLISVVFLMDATWNGTKVVSINNGDYKIGITNSEYTDINEDDYGSDSAEDLTNIRDIYDFKDELGAMMQGEDKTKLVQVVSAKIGSPPRRVRLIVNFASHVTYIPYSITSSSTTFAYTNMNTSDVYYGSDILNLAGLLMRIPISDDDIKYSSVLQAMCSTCNGILGLGSSSPFWLRWESVIVGAGSININTRMDSQKNNVISKCLVDKPSLLTSYFSSLNSNSSRLNNSTDYSAGLKKTLNRRDENSGTSYSPVIGRDNDFICIVKGKIFGVEYMIDLSFWSTTTIVPSKLYWQYVKDKTISTVKTNEENSKVILSKRQNPSYKVESSPLLTKTPNPATATRSTVVMWDDLIIDIITDKENGEMNTVKIRAQDLVVNNNAGIDKGTSTKTVLLMTPDDGETTANGTMIRLGRSTMYSISAYINPGTMEAVVYDWPVTRNSSVSDLIIIFVLVVMFIRWPMTASSIRGKIVCTSIRSGSIKKKTTHRNGFIHHIGDLFRNRQNWAISLVEKNGNEKRKLYIKIAIEIITCISILGIYFSTATRNAIKYFIVFDWYIFASMISLVSMELITVAILIIQKVHWIVGKPLISLYRRRKRFGGMGFNGNDHDINDDVMRNACINELVILERINIIRNSCHQTITMMAIWLVALHVREQTLSTIASLLASSIIVFLVIHSIIIVFILPLRPFAWMWILFSVYQIIFSLTTCVISEKYVLRHFIEASVYNRNPNLIIVSSITYYLAIAAFSAWYGRKKYTPDDYNDLGNDDGP